MPLKVMPLKVSLVLSGTTSTAYSTGAIEFDVTVGLAGAPATNYSFVCRYRELLSLQADLVREAELTAPVLISAAKSATGEARRSSAEALLNSFTDFDRMPARLVEFLGLEKKLSTSAWLAARPPAARRSSSNGTKYNGSARGSATPAAAAPTAASSAADEVKRRLAELRRERLANRRTAAPAAAAVAVSTAAAAPAPALPRRARAKDGAPRALSFDAVADDGGERSDASSSSSSSAAAQPTGAAGAPGAAAAADEADGGAQGLERLVSLLNEAVDLGLSSAPLVAKMLEKVSQKRFTVKHYLTLWSPQVEAARAERGQQQPTATTAAAAAAAETEAVERSAQELAVEVAEKAERADRAVAAARAAALAMATAATGGRGEREKRAAEVERAARVAKEEMAEVAAARRRLSDVRGQGRAAAAAAAAAVALEDTHAEAVTNGECVSPSPATPLKSAGAAVAGGVAGAAAGDAAAPVATRAAVALEWPAEVLRASASDAEASWRDDEDGGGIGGGIGGGDSPSVRTLGLKGSTRSKRRQSVSPTFEGDGAEELSPAAAVAPFSRDWHGTPLKVRLEQERERVSSTDYGAEASAAILRAPPTKMARRRPSMFPRTAPPCRRSPRAASSARPT